MSIATSSSVHFHLFRNSLTTDMIHSRKLLLQASSTATAAASPSASTEVQSLEIPRGGFGSFDANVVMVLSVLLCAVVFSLGLNAILKFAFRFSSLLTRDGTSLPTARLVHTGIRRKALKTFPTVEFSKEAKLPGLDAECVICLSEFEPGERLRILPKCFHGFHVHCIDKWLSSHTSCPKCRNCLTETCRKIVGCTGAATSSDPTPAPAPAESNIVAIAPLERETLICNYRESR